MIQTTTVKPSGLLKDYVCYFAVREFNSFDEKLLKPMTAHHQITMMFMINCKMFDFVNHDHTPGLYMINKLSGPDCVLSGLLTSNKGNVFFINQIKLVTIHFKPTGFYSLFGISPAEITNCLVNCSDLFYNHILRLHEQLQTAKTIPEMIEFIERYLLERLRFRNPKKGLSSMFKISEFLLQQTTNVCSIEKMAYDSNMCLKTFERKFMEEVGLPPRLYERIRRFNKAVETKINRPELSWTKICYRYGYFDQNHFIKDFIKFADETPSVFFKNSPPPAENVTSYHGIAPLFEKTTFRK